MDYGLIIVGLDCRVIDFFNVNLVLLLLYNIGLFRVLKVYYIYRGFFVFWFFNNVILKSFRFLKIVVFLEKS